MVGGGNWRERIIALRDIRAFSVELLDFRELQKAGVLGPEISVSFKHRNDCFSRLLIVADFARSDVRFYENFLYWSVSKKLIRRSADRLAKDPNMWTFPNAGRRYYPLLNKTRRGVYDLLRAEGEGGKNF